MPSKRKANIPLDALRAEKLRELKLRCEKLQRALDAQAGRVLTLKEHDDFRFFVATRLNTSLQVHLRTLAPKLAGLETPQISKLIGEGCDALVRAMHTAEVEWNRDYADRRARLEK